MNERLTAQRLADIARRAETRIRTWSGPSETVPPEAEHNLRSAATVGDVLDLLAELRRLQKRLFVCEWPVRDDYRHAHLCAICSRAAEDGAGHEEDCPIGQALAEEEA